MAFQFRRGTDAERQSITPKAGEPLFVTDTGKIYVGNGTTQGGLLVSSGVSDDNSPSLGGNLDLNNNNIIGTGNINIDGTITATGSINLGDASEDNIIVGGVIGSSLIPNTDGLYDLGSSDFHWRKGYFEDVAVDGELIANSLQIRTIELDDSTTVFDGSTSSLFVESVTANSIEGNLFGPVFASDSTAMVDTSTKTLFSEDHFLGDIKLTTDDGTILRLGEHDNPIEVYINGDSSAIGLGVFGETEAFPGINPNISLLARRGQTINPSIVQNGDSLGIVTFGGYNGEEYSMSAFISAVVDDQDFGNGDTFKSTLNIGSLVGFQAGNFVTINSDGKISAPLVQTGIYQTTNLPDGSVVGLGTIVFDTTTSEFKGWNGVDWAVLG